MTTTTQPNQTNLPEENFGKVLLSAPLSFYMDRNPKIVKEVFDYLEQHFMKGIFNGGEDNKQLCKSVIDSNGRKHGGILYGWYTMLVYFTPLIGGILADKFLGYRNAVVIGAFLMALDMPHWHLKVWIRASFI